MANAASENDDLIEPKSAPRGAHASGPTFAAAEGTVDDVSVDLAQHLERNAGEVIRCHRVSSNRYRCNWWAPQSDSPDDRTNSAALQVTTHRVVKSRMVRASRGPEGLSVTSELSQ